MAEKERPRVGVYVCHCGGNISDYVDVRAVVEEIRREENVVVAKDLMFDCCDTSQNEMIDDIKSKNLDRIVIAACSPKLHEQTFRGTAQRAGLNRYMMYHANIREQSSWAHEDDKKGATAKALGQTRAAVAYACLAEPLERPRIESTQAVLVIGGGIAGIKAAVDLSGMGIQVVLAEKSASLGGRLNEVSEVYPYGWEGPEMVGRLVDELKARKNVTVFTNAAVVSCKGYVGKFEAKIRVSLEGGGEEMINVGVGSVIVATGFDSYSPTKGELGYGTVDGVVTLPQFEAMLRADSGEGIEFRGRKVRDVAFIYCVGSRQVQGELPAPEGSGAPKTPNLYCSRYCCAAAIGASLILNKKFGETATYHLFRDMRTYGANELMYEEAGRKGALFIRFDDENPPVVTQKGDRCSVVVRCSRVENQPVDVIADLVVLVTGMVPRANGELDAALSLPVGSDGFYREIHQKLRPVETTLTGIQIAGTAQGPKNIRETLSSASAASAKAAAFALKDELELEPFVATVNGDRCELNKACLKECPYEAIEVHEGKAWVNTAKCKGCGACVAVCPTEAIQLKGFTNTQARAMIEAMAR